MDADEWDFEIVPLAVRLLKDENGHWTVHFDFDDGTAVIIQMPNPVSERTQTYVEALLSEEAAMAVRAVLLETVVRDAEKVAERAQRN